MEMLKSIAKGSNDNSCCTDENSTRRVLMFPWVAHGHITPFLDLAKKLSERNFTIFLCSIPVNLDSVRNKLDEKYPCSIQLIELHLQATEDFPPQFHTTNGLPKNLMGTLKDATGMECVRRNLNKLKKMEELIRGNHSLKNEKLRRMACWTKVEDCHLDD